MNLNTEVHATIKKDDKGGFIVNRILKTPPKTKINTPKKVTDDMIGTFDNLLSKIAG